MPRTACPTFVVARATHGEDELFSCLESSVELINTTAHVNKLLLAGEERMALRANFNAQITLGGSGLDDFAACTSDRAFLVFGMETLLHIFRTSHSDS